MTEGDEFIARLLERFPVDEPRLKFVDKMLAKLDEARTKDPSQELNFIGWKLLFLAPEIPQDIPGERYTGLFNNPNCMSSTAKWKRTLWSLHLQLEGDPDPDPYWVAWVRHCEISLAYRAMIPEPYWRWKPDKPREDCPRDDETPQDFDDRWRREAKEHHETNRRAKLNGQHHEAQPRE